MYLLLAYFNYIDVKVVIILSFWDTLMFGGNDGDPNQNADQDKDHDKGHDKDPNNKTRRRKKRKKSS
jgi:hypothetical protein